MERVLDEVSFTAADRSGETVAIDAAFIERQVGDLAACRTEVLECCGGARRAQFLQAFAVDLPLIGRWQRPEAALAGPIGAFAARFVQWRASHAGARANIRFRFQAMVTRLHSPRTFSSPRREN